jgi:hypothetical protein
MVQTPFRSLIKIDVIAAKDLRDADGIGKVILFENFLNLIKIVFRVIHMQRLLLVKMKPAPRLLKLTSSIIV